MLIAKEEKESWRLANPLPIAFDVGMNNGDDSDYYLKKGYRVVGIDANPSMCDICEDRFREQIRLGLMSILNIGVGDRRSRETFSVNVEKPAISTFKPQKFDSEHWAPREWRAVDVEVHPISEIVRRFGVPSFMKIDVEFYDEYVLADLLRHKIMPEYITSEVHEQSCFDLLVSMGYRRFRLLPGDTVNDRFGLTSIKRLDGSRLAHLFPIDASGPFGDDFPDPWVSADDALNQLLAHGLGWIDVHATC